MRYYLLVDPQDGQRAIDRELAGLLVEAKNGDEIIVETIDQRDHARALLGLGDSVEIIIDKDAIEVERARVRSTQADAVLVVRRRMTGPDRNDPHGTPGPTPGSRSFAEVTRSPPPDHVHRPAAPSDGPQE